MDVEEVLDVHDEERTDEETRREEVTREPKTDATKTAAKKPPVADTLSVSDVAREMGVDPKKARAALRASGRGADGKPYARVARGSDEHTALMLFLEGNQDGVDSSPKEKP